MIGDADRPFKSSTKKKKGRTTAVSIYLCCCCTSTYFQEVDRRGIRTATLARLWSRVPCCYYKYNTAASPSASAVLLLTILMLPLLRVQHRQSYEYQLIFSLKTERTYQTARMFVRVGCFSRSRSCLLASHCSEALVFSFLVFVFFLGNGLARFVVHFTCFMSINHCDCLVYPVSHMLGMFLG